VGCLEGFYEADRYRKQFETIFWLDHNIDHLTGVGSGLLIKPPFAIPCRPAGMNRNKHGKKECNKK